MIAWPTVVDRAGGTRQPRRRAGISGRPATNAVRGERRCRRGSSRCSSSRQLSPTCCCSFCGRGGHDVREPAGTRREALCHSNPFAMNCSASSGSTSGPCRSAARLHRRCGAPPPRAQRHPSLQRQRPRLAHGLWPLAGDVHEGRFVTVAAEWFLDNFHLVTGDVVDIRRNLPRTYYRELPAARPASSRARRACTPWPSRLTRHTDNRLDEDQLRRFLNTFQSVTPLTIGELWAWPSVLKLALIENLRRLAEETSRARATRVERGRPSLQPWRWGGRADAGPAFPPTLHLRPRRPAPASAARDRLALVAGATRRSTSTWRARHLTTEDAVRERAAAPGGGAGVGGQRHHESAVVRHARLARVRRSREPRRAGAPAAIRRAPTAGWTFSAAIGCGRPSRPLSQPNRC